MRATPTAIPAKFPASAGRQAEQSPGVVQTSSRTKICPFSGFGNASAEPQNNKIRTNRFMPPP